MPAIVEFIPGNDRKRQLCVGPAPYSGHYPPTGRGGHSHVTQAAQERPTISPYQSSLFSL